MQIFNGPVASSAKVSDADGRFAIAIRLNPGLNALQVHATHFAADDPTRAWLHIQYAPVSVELTVRITEPAGLALFVRENPLRIAGETTPGATVVVNDIHYPEVGANGDWSITIGLPGQGEHTITATASLNGESAADQITVTYTPQ